MNRLMMVLIAVSLAACSTPQTNRMGNIATTPLSDLNLTDTTIPPVLVQARAKLYAAPQDTSCSGIWADVARLDEVLGPDLDAPEGEGEDAAAQVGNAAMGAVQRTVEGAIPFRSWLRKLSGAERHTREVAAAVLAGTVRRGFLKGLAQAQACAAAPVKTAA